MKLPYIKMYDMSEVPDHIAEEISELSVAILSSMVDLFKDKDPNMILGALNFAHAFMIVHCGSADEKELEKLIKMSAVSLYKNAEARFINIHGKGFESKDNHSQ